MILQRENALLSVYVHLHGHHGTVGLLAVRHAARECRPDSEYAPMTAVRVMRHSGSHASLNTAHLDTLIGHNGLNAVVHAVMETS